MNCHVDPLYSTLIHKLINFIYLFQHLTVFDLYFIMLLVLFENLYMNIIKVIMIIGFHHVPRGYGNHLVCHRGQSRVDMGRDWADGWKRQT